MSPFDLERPPKGWVRMRASGARTCNLSSAPSWWWMLVVDRRGLLVGLTTGLTAALLFSSCRSATIAPPQHFAGLLMLVEGKEAYELGKHLEILNDPTRRLSIEE